MLVDSEAPRVLLVDDEVELLESLRRVLARRGLAVVTAASGEAALEQLASLPVDVVVLDIKMPGMDGLEVLRRIKRDFRDREVILLTGHPSVENAAAGVKLGAVDYVTKPPDIGSLVELIRRAVLRRRQGGQPQIYAGPGS